ncbi:MAG: ATP-binding protein [Chloroflexi bacterium]|nr:ATP-binding protein [Chloroflexota bacterium]OJV89755.1 MAG: AAA family ATPase [Chloroflexi bacterium 54-19]
MTIANYSTNNIRLKQVEGLLPAPTSVADTDISPQLIGDLVMKAIHQYTTLSVTRISDMLKLPFFGVVEPVLTSLRKSELVEISHSEGLGEMTYQWVLTPKGRERVREILNRSNYVGPAPVSLEKYRRIVRVQTITNLRVVPAQVKAALADMVVSDDLMEVIGPAINTGQSIFLYGAAGNGKTFLSEHIARLLTGDIFIPYAIEADGFIIKVFDPNIHEISNDPLAQADPTSEDNRVDTRWALCRRPVVVVGGELTMASLDLIYDEVYHYYEAPFQLKANGGMFLIDDFGRQQMRPRDLLNRWIVPLEKRLDFLSLMNGKKIEVPFDEVIVFSTNLAPRDLVDEAFLRRIQNKIEVHNPTFEEYREIMKRNCALQGVPYSEEGMVYLLKEYYIKPKRELRSCQPRDLLKQIIGIAAYQGVAPRLSRELIDPAAATYFVEL